MLTSAAAMIAAAAPGETTPVCSPSEATAAGTPSCTVAASPAASGCLVSAAAARWSTTLKTTSSAAKAISEPCVERAHVDPRTEHDEEERDEEAVADAGHLAREPLGPLDGGDDETDREPGDQDARAGSQCQPGEAEQHDQRQAQVESPAPVPREVSDLVEPARRADDADPEVERDRAGCDCARTEQRAESVRRGERQRNRDDGRHVGDRHLRGDDQPLFPLEQVRLLEARDEHRGRPARENDGIHGSVREPGDLGRCDSRERGEDACDRRGDRAPDEPRTEVRCSQGHLHPRAEHQHRETDRGHEGERRVRGMDQVESGAPDHEAGQQLADDHGDEDALAGGQERPAEPGDHDHGEDTEGHEWKSRRFSGLRSRVYGLGR